MANILDAFVTLKKESGFLLGTGEHGNRIQVVGDGLETFIKDLFANTLDVNMDHQTKLRKLSKTFSYLGNSNQPPDAILTDGDALEIKKVDSPKGSIQLNSSPPKSKLVSTDTRINNTCRQLAEKEGWIEKDMIYAIGSQSGDKLVRLWFVYGDCYAASNETYELVSSRVKYSIAKYFDEAELSVTNEIAGLPKVDPLNITSLRVRGMWIIKNPSVVFSKYVKDSIKKFKAYCILSEEKYDSFNHDSKSLFEKELDDKMSIDRIKIPDPNNPASLTKAILIKYEI